MEGLPQSANLQPHHRPTDQNVLVANRTIKLLKKLGEGAFGEIFIGLSIQTGLEVAVKRQSINTNRRQLELEFKMLQTLTNSEEDVAIPRLYGYYSEETYNIMVLELLGPSLEDLFNMCEKRFSLKTTLMVGVQMLELIRFVHSKDTLHRDIKPDNFLIGCRNNVKRVYMIDFGLSRRFKTSKGEHISYKDNKTLTGTARYVSINTHIGIEQSRRDDLESFVYVLIYFLKGSLPWQNLKATDKKEKYERIMERKLSTPVRFLCSGLPVQIQQMLDYIRGLQFEQTPDYPMLMNKLKTVACEQNINIYDGVYDWLQVARTKKQRIGERNQQKLREMSIESAGSLPNNNH